MIVMAQSLASKRLMLATGEKTSARRATWNARTTSFHAAFGRAYVCKLKLA